MDLSVGKIQYAPMYVNIYQFIAAAMLVYAADHPKVQELYTEASDMEKRVWNIRLNQIK
jgi:hypothetical protein